MKLSVADGSVLPTMSEEAIATVAALETVLMREPQVKLPTTHTLHAGMYARTVHIPAGVVLTGALIRVPTVLIISGRVTVFTGPNNRLALNGYHVIAGSAGRKQAFYARADTDLTMVFPTSATTVTDAEAEFTDEYDKLMTRRGLALEFNTLREN